MKKLFSILLSALLCASIVVFAPINHCYADDNDEENYDESTAESSIPTPCVTDGKDDDF